MPVPVNAPPLLPRKSDDNTLIRWHSFADAKAPCCKALIRPYAREANDAAQFSNTPMRVRCDLKPLTTD